MTAALHHGVTDGWEAALALTYVKRGARTVLAERRHRGPLMVQRPFYPEPGGVCHTYLLHPPAGVVGGDRLQVDIELAAGATALVTTPAATKWYRSAGAGARLDQRLKLAAGAALEWLPQENIVFDGARAAITTTLELADGARFCGWEMLCLGRPACGERYTHGSVDLRCEIATGGQPVVSERLRLRDGVAAGLRGHAVTATLFANGADGRALELARAVCAASHACLCAASLRGEWLICRGLAATVEPLRAAFGALWCGLRPLLTGRVAALPRIWST